MLHHDSFEDVFQVCLDELLGGQESLDAILARHADHADELRQPLEVALLLSNSKSAFEPRPGFIQASKSRLMQKIAAEATPAPPQGQSLWGYVAQLFRSVFSRKMAYSFALVTVFSLLVFVYSGVTLARATALSIPGDLIYPAKIANEDIHLAVTPGLAARARLFLDYSSDRMVELSILVFEERHEYIQPTLARYQSQILAATHTIGLLSEKNPRLGRQLAGVLENKLANDELALTIMAESVPAAVSIALDSSVAAVQTLETTTQEIIEDADAAILATATLASPTYTATLLLSDLISPTATSLDLTDTPTPTLTPTSTLEFTATLAPTPTPTVVQEIAPTATPDLVDDDEIKPTKKPSKTPKPTKTEKVKDDDDDDDD